MDNAVLLEQTNDKVVVEVPFSSDIAQKWTDVYFAQRGIYVTVHAVVSSSMQKQLSRFSHVGGGGGGDGDGDGDAAAIAAAAPEENESAKLTVPYVYFKGAVDNYITPLMKPSTSDAPPSEPTNSLWSFVESISSSFSPKKEVSAVVTNPVERATTTTTPTTSSPGMDTVNRWKQSLVSMFKRSPGGLNMYTTSPLFTLSESDRSFLKQSQLPADTDRLLFTLDCSASRLFPGETKVFSGNLAYAKVFAKSTFQLCFPLLTILDKSVVENQYPGTYAHRNMIATELIRVYKQHHQQPSQRATPMIVYPTEEAPKEEVVDEEGVGEEEDAEAEAEDMRPVTLVPK